MYAEKGYVSRGDYCNIASGRKTEETIKLQQVNYSCQWAGIYAVLKAMIMKTAEQSERRKTQHFLCTYEEKNPTSSNNAVCIDSFINSADIYWILTMCKAV